jgi:23S rRNA (guanosine2251-2'-O)-methyltransferase
VEVIYGRNSVLEALKGRRRVFRVLVADNVKRGGPITDIERAAAAKEVPVQVRPRQQLDTMLRSTNHQGVAAEVEDYPYADIDDILTVAREHKEPPLILLLDTVQDPQNFGTLLRTSEAIGVHGIVLPERRSVQVTPAVCHVSVGACEHLAIVQVTNLVRTIEELKQIGVWIVGLEGVPEAKLYTEFDYSSPVGIVVGSEGFGLSRLTKQKCDELVKLPMRGRISSLNAAVAGSIVLYEVWRQRYGSPVAEA